MSLSKESKDADRGTNWSYEETITLINIWSDTNIQEEFEKKEFLRKCKDAAPNKLPKYMDTYWLSVFYPPKCQT